jgi:hypothetical protein
LLRSIPQFFQLINAALFVPHYYWSKKAVAKCETKKPGKTKSENMAQLKTSSCKPAGQSRGKYRLILTPSLAPAIIH